MGVVVAQMALQEPQGVLVVQVEVEVGRMHSAVARHKEILEEPQDTVLMGELALAQLLEEVVVLWKQEILMVSKKAVMVDLIV